MSDLSNRRLVWVYLASSIEPMRVASAATPIVRNKHTKEKAADEAEHGEEGEDADDDKDASDEDDPSPEAAAASAAAATPKAETEEEETDEKKKRQETVRESLGENVRGRIGKHVIRTKVGTCSCPNRKLDALNGRVRTAQWSMEVVILPPIGVGIRSICTSIATSGRGLTRKVAQAIEIAKNLAEQFSNDRSQWTRYIWRTEGNFERVQ